MGLAVDLHEHLVEMPLPLSDLAHVAGAAEADLAGEHRAKPIHPKPHALMANIDTPFVERIFDIPQRKRKADVHHDRELDDLMRRLEIAERISRHAAMLRDLSYPFNRPLPLTMPVRGVRIFTPISIRFHLAFHAHAKGRRRHLVLECPGRGRGKQVSAITGGKSNADR